MKRILLAVCLLVGGIGNVNAQCTPDPSLFTGVLFGVSPDTLTDFAPGMEGVFYSDTMHLLIPLNAQDIMASFPGVIIDSVQLVTLAGLPPGLTLFCNSQTNGPCTVLPTMTGCAVIQGTPTQQGIFPLTIEVIGFAANGLFSVPFTLGGYQIDIGPVGIEELNDALFADVKNVPNPFSSRTDIEFVLNSPTEVTLHVFDLLGQEVFERAERLGKGKNKITFESDEYEQGIYIYQLSAGGVAHTGRMILDR